MTLSFDIETGDGIIDDEFRAAVVKHDAELAARRPDEVRPDPLARLGISPFTGRVLVISCWDDVVGEGVCLVNDGPLEHELPKGFKLVACHDETELLTKFWGICRRQRRGRFATFNGMSFDVPFLIARSLANDVRVHTPIITAKPWEDVHVDLIEKLCPKGSQRAPFDFVCRALGVPTPKDGGITGADVNAAWNAGRRGEVAAYCCRDVAALVVCLERWDRFALGAHDPAVGNT